MRPAGTDRNGRQRVDVTVLAVFNRPTTDRHVTLSMPDRGQMLGYPFVVGETYVVAVRESEVGLCSPTQPLSARDGALDTAVTELRDAARAGGVPVGVPPADAPSPVAPEAAVPATAPARSASGTTAPLALGGAVALALAGGGTAAARRARRRQTTGGPRRRGPTT